MRRIEGVTRHAKDECLGQDHVRDEGRQCQQSLGEHRPPADREGIRLDVELLGGGRTTHEAMPSGDCATGNGDEQDGPDRPEDALRIVQERTHVQLDGDGGTRAQRKRSQESADQDQKDRGVCRVECEVIRRLNEGRGRKDRSQVQDEHADARPDRNIP